MNFKEYVLHALSDNGEPSSKRLLGCIIILSYVVIVSVMALRLGATEIVKDLLETGFIGGCSLVGISSVTDIFKGNNNEQESTN